MKQFTSIFHEEVISIEENKAANDARREALKNRAKENSIRDARQQQLDTKADEAERKANERRQKEMYQKDKTDYNKRQSNVTSSYHLNKKYVDAVKESFLSDIDLD